MRGLGCILDEPEIVAGELRTRHVAALIGADAAYAPVRDWRDQLDFVPDQGATETCVAWSLSSAAFRAARIAGTPIARPSVRWLYAIAHWLGLPGTPISPYGRSARTMALAAERHGLIAESRWPFDVAHVTEPPPVDLDMAGADALLAGWYRIGDGDVPTQMRMALNAGHFPMLAIQVRESFDAYCGGIYEPNGSTRGWHMLVAVGYSPGTFVLLNSWGADHGDGGFVTIPDDVVIGPEVAGIVVVTTAPKEVR
jgi:hypothetical protein